MCISVANNRLFVGSIPKSKTKEQIVEEFAKVTGESNHFFPSAFISVLHLSWNRVLWDCSFDQIRCTFTGEACPLSIFFLN